MYSGKLASASPLSIMSGMNLADTYSESAEGLRITRQRALQELVKHGLVFEQLDGWERDEFEGLFNSDRMCDAGALLRWLGY